MEKVRAFGVHRHHGMRCTVWPPWCDAIVSVLDHLRSAAPEDYRAVRRLCSGFVVMPMVRARKAVGSVLVLTPGRFIRDGQRDNYILTNRTRVELSHHMILVDVAQPNYVVAHELAHLVTVDDLSSLVADRTDLESAADRRATDWGFDLPKWCPNPR